ncbi:MAG: hypothetical protein AAFX00_02605 [Pseudomonadota bacterium]
MAPKPRRNFLHVATLFMCTFAVGAGFWHLGGAMAPDATQKMRPLTFFDPQTLAPGEVSHFPVHKTLVYVRRLTDEQIAEIRAVNVAELPDTDAANANLAADALATFENRTLELGGTFVVVEGRGINEYTYFLPDVGNVNGWFEGRYAAHYDVLGRLRKGYGTNMPVPAYDVTEDGRIGFWPERTQPLTEDQLDRILYGPGSS